MNRHLSRVWARNQVGCAEQIKKFLIAQPVALLDDFIVHHRDMRGWSAECGGTEPQEQSCEFFNREFMGNCAAALASGMTKLRQSA